ncbi:hypothetical protein BC829DRAFT_406884 [Chytridium lagenaria]|nr:hypothetical protein BC829DRAFT_406884 [Chytridium lagenaria]
MDLTSGFVRATMESTTSSEDFLNPVVQLLNIKKYTQADSSGSESERYRVILSDGEFFIQAMLSTQLNVLVTEEKIARHSLVALNHFICNVVGNKRILILLSIECLNPGQKDYPRLGAPVEYKSEAEGGPPLAAAAPKPANMSLPKQQQHMNSGNRPAPNNGSSGKNPYARQMEPHVAVFPIKSLSPYQNKWTIRARVASKSDIRHFQTARGEGKLFSVTFADESGEIRATGFNEAVTTLYDVLEEGSVYYVSKAPIKVARKQYSGGIDNEYEMTLEASTEIRLCDDPSLAPKIRMNRVMLSDLYNHEKDANVDVVGVVREVHDLTTLKPLQKRDIVIVDESKFSAETFNATDNPVLALKGGRVGDYGGRCLSVGSNSSMQLNPEMQEAFFLRGWYDSEGSTAEFTGYNASGVGAAGNAGGGEMRMDAFKTIAQIADENLGMNEKPDWFTIAGTICFIRDNNMWYPACHTPDCNKKVFESDRGWRCEKCDKAFPSPNYRYICSMAVADHTGQEWLQLFNDQAEALFAKSANELNEIKEADEPQFKALVKNAIWTQMNFKVRAKAEFYQSEQKVRLTATGCNKIDYGVASEQLLQTIATYGV